MTVSELSHKLKVLVEDNFCQVTIRGEVSGLKVHTSGHMYFALKDQNAVLDAVCWRGMVGKLSFRPVEGREIVCHGRLTTYPGRSKYQVVVSQVFLAGDGALLQLLEERKKKLLHEGLFAPEHKKPLPFLPRCVGVVTSRTGAVIRDILHRIADRFPRTVLLWPVNVQGQSAAEEIVTAIRGFNALPDQHADKPDVLIVGRGGGSIEDLWTFNEEAVVRAIFASRIPVISAVGHETDTTLVDFVSDYRAPTPTAAAEKAVPVHENLHSHLREYSRRMTRALFRQWELKMQRYDEAVTRVRRAVLQYLHVHHMRLARLQVRSPQETLAFHQQGLVALGKRLDRACTGYLAACGQQLAAHLRVLSSLSYHNVLNRGYGIVQDSKGAIIKHTEALRQQKQLTITLSDGRTSVDLAKVSES